MIRPGIRRLFRLALGRRERAVRDVDEEIRLHLELRAEQGALSTASFSPDGHHVVTAGADHVARIWALEPGVPPIELNHSDVVNDARFSPDGRTVATAAGGWRLLDSVAGGRFADKQGRFVVILWDAASGRERLRLPEFDAPVAQAEFSPDGKRLLTVSGNRAMRLWDAENGRLAAELVGAGSVQSATFSADGRWIVSASADATARVCGRRSEFVFFQPV